MVIVNNWNAYRYPGYKLSLADAKFRLKEAPGNNIGYNVAEQFLPGVRPVVSNWADYNVTSKVGVNQLQTFSDGTMLEKLALNGKYFLFGEGFNEVQNTLVILLLVILFGIMYILFIGGIIVIIVSIFYIFYLIIMFIINLFR